MPNFKLTTPVVLIIFSKLDTARRVFAEIARAKPTNLLVISDAAWPDKPGEPIGSMAFPLRHPFGIMRDLGVDEYEYKRFIRSFLLKRVYYVIRRWCTGR